MKWTIRNIIAVTVLAVWTVVALVSLVSKEYTTLGAVTPIMLAVLGILANRRERDN